MDLDTMTPHFSAHDAPQSRLPSLTPHNSALGGRAHAAGQQRHSKRGKHSTAGICIPRSAAHASDLVLRNTGDQCKQRRGEGACGDKQLASRHEGKGWRRLEARQGADNDKKWRRQRWAAAMRRSLQGLGCKRALSMKSVGDEEAGEGGGRGHGRRRR